MSKSIDVWRWEWFALTIAGALEATALDIVLLQKKYNFFTGGFLSINYLEGIADKIGFVVISLLADTAIVGLTVCIMQLVFYRTRLNGKSRCLLIQAIALGPIVITDFFTYRLSAYLGDVFDLTLMYELTGKNPSEILAVSFQHLKHLIPYFLMMGSGVMVFLAFITWWLYKYFPKEKREARLRIPSGRIFMESSIIFILGLSLVSVVRISSDVFHYGLKQKPSGQLFGFIAEKISDIDRDGYGLFRRPFDPAPFNSKIFPYAVDIPGNGVDEDGVGGDLPGDRAQYTEGNSGVGMWRFKPNILFIMLESFRADTIGMVHNGKQVTPILDHLVRQGISLKNAFSHNGFTVESRRHIFSGSLADLSEETSLINDLKANGYQVAYFSGQDESFGTPEVPSDFNLADVAFDARVEPHRRFTTFSTAGSLGLPRGVVQEKVNAFLDTRKSSQPLFLYVNFYDTHFPYHHSGILPLINDIFLTQFQIGPSRREDLWSMYLNTVANIDRSIVDLLDKVHMALGEDLAIIVTADHGESLFDDGFLGHGYILNDTQTRIPFIFTDIPIVIEEPFGQAALRNAINVALLTGISTETQAPTVNENPMGRVFQYLGTINRPRQIAFRSLAGRTIYDFRNGLVQMEKGGWRQPSSLSTGEYRDFQELIHFWESLRLAQHEKKRKMTPNY